MKIQKVITGSVNDIYTVVLKDGNVFSVAQYGKEIAPVEISREEREVHEGVKVSLFDPESLPILMEHPSIEGVELRLMGRYDLDIDNLEESELQVNNHLKLGFSNGAPVGLYNMYKETCVGKDQNKKTRYMYGHSVVATVFKKFKDSEVENIVFKASSEDDFYTNITDIELLEWDMGCEPNAPACGCTPLSFNEVKLSCDVPTEVEPDGVISCNVQLIDYDDTVILKEGIEIYLKSNCGVISHSKLITDVNGQATFRVRADMLTSDDTIKLKIGFKYYSNVVSADIKVN